MFNTLIKCRIDQPKQAPYQMLHAFCQCKTFFDIWKVQEELLVLTVEFTKHIVVVAASTGQ